MIAKPKLVAGLLALSLWSGTALAAWKAESVGTYFSTIDDATYYTIKFSEAPDFTSKDSQGNLLNEFSIYFYELNKPWGIGEIYSLIYGANIDPINQTLEVRNGDVYGDPDNGGWGSVRGLISYNLNDDVLTFKAPWALLNDNNPFFSWHLESYDNGRKTGDFDGVFAIPEPSTYALMLSGLGLIALRRRKG